MANRDGRSAHKPKYQPRNSDREVRVPRRMPYGGRQDAREMCRLYQDQDFGMKRMMRERDEAQAAAEKGEQEETAVCLEECRLLGISVTGNECLEELQKQLYQHKAGLQQEEDRRAHLVRIGVEENRLLDDRDVEAEWTRYQTARRTARSLGLRHDDNTPLADLERAIDADYQAMEDFAESIGRDGELQ